MDNRILILETEVEGHHLEYINHFLIKSQSSNDKYIFYLPKEFDEIKKHNLDWKYKENVQIYTYDYKNKKSFIAKTYYKTRLLIKTARYFKVTHVFLISLMSFLPSLLFVFPKIKVSGIIYSIYLYRWNNSSFWQRIFDVFKYLLLSSLKIVDKVYILNDKNSARHLNKLYKTRKFRFLVDPFVPIEDKKTNLDIYNIKEDNTIYFHFGSLSKRKGTLEIMYSLDYIEKTILRNSTFIFAGKISEDIKEEFFEKYEKYKNLTQIIIQNEFCDYSLIASFCKKSNILLMPYKLVSLSSGVIGYAAQFGIPVLAPKQGLIGKLVRSYKLGYSLETVTPNNIASFINHYDKNCNYVVSDKYLETNTVSAFNNCIVFE